MTIPVSQHIGAPAIPVVNKGDYVKTGQVIATGKGFVSSNIHSSVSGKINKIDTIVDSQDTNRQLFLSMLKVMNGLIRSTEAVKL